MAGARNCLSIWARTFRGETDESVIINRIGRSGLRLDAHRMVRLVDHDVAAVVLDVDLERIGPAHGHGADPGETVVPRVRPRGREIAARHHVVVSSEHPCRSVVERELET